MVLKLAVRIAFCYSFIDNFLILFRRTISLNISIILWVLYASIFKAHFVAGVAGSFLWKLGQIAIACWIVCPFNYSNWYFYFSTKSFIKKSCNRNSRHGTCFPDSNESFIINYRRWFLFRTKKIWKENLINSSVSSIFLLWNYAVTMTEYGLPLPTAKSGVMETFSCILW